MSAIIYDFETGQKIDEGTPEVSLEEHVKEFITKDIDTAVKNMIALNNTVISLKTFLASIADEMEKNPNIPMDNLVKGIKMFLSA